MAEKPAQTPTPIRALFRCVHCGWVLGQIANGVFHEDRGDKSGFPIVRRCVRCGKRNVKLAA